MSELDLNQIPELVLEGGSISVQELTPIAMQMSHAASELDDSMLNEAEKKAVKDLEAKIDLTNTNTSLFYGSDAQKNIVSFSEMALTKVRAKDMGEVGGMLTGLVGELRGFSFDEDEPKGLMKLFKKSSNTIANLKARYDTVEKNVGKISVTLESRKLQLMKDIALFDQMYQMNLSHYKALTMYILAGKQKLEDVRQNELVALMQKAQQTGLPEDAQAASDLENACNRFEKKIHDLDLTRMITIQMAPQIRLVQNNDSMMAEKIQSSLINTIPRWKNQMVLALGILHSREAVEAQRAVSDMTNEMLKKNADTLKTGSVEIAKEAERGIVDIETLQYTNRQLISTLDEILAIQQDGHQKRAEAEVELRRIESEMKVKLLEVIDRSR